MKFMKKIGAAAVSAALVLGCSPVLAVAAEQMAPVEKRVVTWMQGEACPTNDG